jgi:hypothetical protein
MECVSKRETLWGHHVGRQRGEVECTGEWRESMYIIYILEDSILNPPKYCLKMRGLEGLRE